IPYSALPQYTGGMVGPSPPAIPLGSQPPSSVHTIKEDLQNYVRGLVAASVAAPRAKSVVDYCKLPPVFFPPGFQAPKYRRYDGTSDPHHHISGFVMDSHQYLHNKALWVHLFQKSLEGEALSWFTSLSATELASFDIVAERFVAYFSYLTHQSPTLYELVMEKMKPDEDFVVFANRWRTMASRSEVIIPENQAVTMIINNTIPQLRAILMLSEMHTFQQLYAQAKVVQAQIKEFLVPNMFEPRIRGRKSAPVPTTEGVMINEQVSILNNPPNKPLPRPHLPPPPVVAPPPPQQPSPAPPQRTYHNAPPPTAM